MMLFAVILYEKLSHIIINNNIKVCLQAYYKDPCPSPHSFVLTVVGRAFLKEHSDAGTFVDQHIAAGAFSRRLAQIYENYFGDDKGVDWVVNNVQRSNNGPIFIKIFNCFKQGSGAEFQSFEDETFYFTLGCEKVEHSFSVNFASKFDKKY